LLLRKGQVVTSERQLASLVELGLFAEGEQGDHSHKEAPQKRVDPPSVLRMLNSAQERLGRLLHNLAGEADVSTKIMDVAKNIFIATTLSPDVAHGCILLNQKSGSYAVRHCVNTAIVAISVARIMKKSNDELKAITAAALTMNVSMLRQQDVWQDRTNALSPAEIEAIKKHPEESVALLKKVGVDNSDWLSFVLAHHENSEGTGYPLGAGAGQIAQNARILSFADHYCASISMRKYRRTLLPHAALRDVLMVEGKPHDPLLAACFIKEIGNYPAGTFVRLGTDELGVVIRRGETPGTPLVQALINPRGVALTIPIQRDTAKPLFGIREAVLNDGKMLRFSLQQLWGNEAAL
ncbi:MAG TPA: HD domain-containing phosphohydrolase, partial [Burkholderiaceae bacterium]|nr:HD domain-containing phosphohydrolase [Burkholderiaceae bacterium]